MDLTGPSGSTRYPSIEPATKGDRVLIVAPHMDDETVGAGAYALDAIRRGAEVLVAFMTAGDGARFSARILSRSVMPTRDDYLHVGRTRIAEAADALRILGVPPEHTFVLGYPDRGLRPMIEQPLLAVRSTSTDAVAVPYEKAMSPGAAHTVQNVVADLRRILDLVRPTTVITPVPFDVHPDHNAASELVDLAIDSTQHVPNRLGYLVHASRLKSVLWMPERALMPPVHMRSFTWATYPVSTDAQVIKAAMLAMYKSQRPYTYFLRNSFVRRNELFFAYAPQPVDDMVHAATPFSCAPYSSPSSL